MGNSERKNAGDFAAEATAEAKRIENLTPAQEIDYYLGEAAKYLVEPHTKKLDAGRWYWEAKKLFDKIAASLPAEEKSEFQGRLSALENQLGLDLEK